MLRGLTFLACLLACWQTYHVHDLDAVQHGGEIKDTLHNNDIEEGNSAEPQTVQGPPPPIHSYAFPLHEEPEDPERTCAICLDTFGEYLVLL